MSCNTNDITNSSVPCPVLQENKICPLWMKEQEIKSEVIISCLTENKSLFEVDKKIFLLLRMKLPQRCLYDHSFFSEKSNSSTFINEEKCLKKLISLYLTQDEISIPLQALTEEHGKLLDQLYINKKNIVLPEQKKILWSYVPSKNRYKYQLNLSYLANTLYWFKLELLNNKSVQSKFSFDSLPVEFKQYIERVTIHHFNCNDIKFIFILCSSIYSAIKTPGQNDCTKELSSLIFQFNNLLNPKDIIQIFIKDGHKIEFYDFSHNKLETLNILFLLTPLKSPNLLALSLHDNPITRKPDYETQVQRTLSHIYVLDGKRIRKAPLSLPHPKNNLTETPEIMRGKAFLFDYFNAIEDFSLKGIGFDMQDEAIFINKFLHPDCIFSITTDPSLILFDFKSNQHINLSPEDIKDLTTMQRNLINYSRDLNKGRSASKFIASGPKDLLKHYMSTIYPIKFKVSHTLKMDSISSYSIRISSDNKNVKKDRDVISTVNKYPDIFMTVHGIMKWTTPSMDLFTYISCAFDRTIVLKWHQPSIIRTFQGMNIYKKKAQLGKYLLSNDMIYLRPHIENTSILFDPYSLVQAERMSRLYNTSAIIGIVLNPVNNQTEDISSKPYWDQKVRVIQSLTNSNFSFEAALHSLVPLKYNILFQNKSNHESSVRELSSFEASYITDILNKSEIPMELKDLALINSYTLNLS